MKSLQNIISTLLVALTCTLAGNFAYAQSPEAVNYQAVVRDVNGQIIPNQSVSFRLSVLLGSPTGTPVYAETHTLSTNQFGLTNLQIGTGTVVSGTFAGIDWANGSHYLQVELDETGGSNYTLMGASEMVSVPYALHAKTVEIDQVDDADADPANELQTLTGSGADVTLSNGGGTVTVDVNDADSDPSNELQTMTQSGSTVTLSNSGGTINIDDADADPANELQTMTQSGSTVTLSNSGGTINIDDADADPANEFNTGMTLSGDTLSLTDGGGTMSVPLGSLIDDGDWSRNGTLVYNDQDSIAIGTNDNGGLLAIGDYNPSFIQYNNMDSLPNQVWIGGPVNGGGSKDVTKLMIGHYDNDGSVVYPIAARDENGNTDFYLRNRPTSTGLPFAYFGGNMGINTDTTWGRLAVNGNIRMLNNDNEQKMRTYTSTDQGRMDLFGSNGNSSIRLMGITSTKGYIAAMDDGAYRAALTTGSSDGAGQLFTLGPNGSFSSALYRTGADHNCGYLFAMDSSGNDRAAMYVNSLQVGLIYLRGNTGQTTVRSTYLNGNEDHGYFSVHDAGGEEAGMYVNASGQGVVWGDVKNFRMDHPTQSGKEIWYASLEGPEAAAYVRGTGQLVNGTGTVEFPEHFELVANSQTMTVVLTPLSGQSKGLAVIEKTEQGFKVVELNAGSGSYEFDWEAKAVRKGYENYRVIRDASEMEAGDTDVGPMKADFELPEDETAGE